MLKNILKIPKWENINGINVPTKMFFVDGGSVYSKELKDTDKNIDLIGYEYFLGQEKEDRLNKGVIITKPYGRWFDEYPNPYLIKRGIYHNWKIIESLKKRETEVLEQIIPYLFLIKSGTEKLATENIKTYSQTELEDKITQFQTLIDELKSTKNILVGTLIPFIFSHLGIFKIGKEECFHRSLKYSSARGFIPLGTCPL